MPDSMGRRLQEAMRDMRIESAAELARLVDTSAASAGNWLNDKIKTGEAKAALLLRIAHVLNVRPEWLLLGEGAKRTADQQAVIPTGTAAFQRQTETAIDDLRTAVLIQQATAAELDPEADIALLAQLAPRRDALAGFLAAFAQAAEHRVGQHAAQARLVRKPATPRRPRDKHQS